MVALMASVSGGSSEFLLSSKSPGRCFFFVLGTTVCLGLLFLSLVSVPTSLLPVL